jgi:hypothetical protein
MRENRVSEAERGAAVAIIVGRLGDDGDIHRPALLRRLGEGTKRHCAGKDEGQRGN